MFPFLPCRHQCSPLHPADSAEDEPLQPPAGGQRERDWRPSSGCPGLRAKGSLYLIPSNLTRQLPLARVFTGKAPVTGVSFVLLWE